MLLALKENKIFKKFISWTSLFGSFGTLICCAIPSTLVLLGFGSTLASLVGNFPQIVWLSENKGYVFGFSFFMLAISFGLQKFSQVRACPIDYKQDCETTKSWSNVVLYVSLVLNLIGVFYAFVLPHLFK